MAYHMRMLGAYMHIIWLIICMYCRIWDVTGHGTLAGVWRRGLYGRQKSDGADDAGGHGARRRGPRSHEELLDPDARPRPSIQGIVRQSKMTSINPSLIVLTCALCPFKRPV